MRIWWRDLAEKRADYAEAGIAEYWIADPRDETLTVLALRGEAYVEHGRYGRGEVAASALLEGFSAEVSAVFDALEIGAWQAWNYRTYGTWRVAW